MFVLFSIEIHSVTSICWDFSSFFSISSHTIQRCSTCIGPSHTSSSTVPTALWVLTFHVAMVISSLPRSLAHVAHLSFPPWYPTGNADVVPGCDQSGMYTGYSIIRCCHWWCVLGISLVRRCPLLSRLQVYVEWPSPRRLSFWTRTPTWPCYVFTRDQANS